MNIIEFNTDIDGKYPSPDQSTHDKHACVPSRVLEIVNTEIPKRTLFSIMAASTIVINDFNIICH